MLAKQIQGSRWWLGMATAIAIAGCAGATGFERPVAQGTVSGDGVELFYRVIGRGADTVVAIGGGPGRAMEYLGGLVGPLADNHTWIVYDPRGAGRSSPRFPGVSVGLPADVADLERLRNHFRLDRLTLVGHNTGAAIASHYAASHAGRVNRLLLVSPYPISQGFVWAWHLLDRDTALFRTGGASYRTAKDPDGAAAFCRRYWFWFFQPVFVPQDLPSAGAARAVCREADSSLVDPERYQLAWLRTATGHDWRASFNSVTAPALVIEGVRSTPRHVYEVHAESWAGAFPNGRLLALRGAALFPWLSNPAEFQDAAQTFLGGAWPTSAVQPVVDSTVAHDDVEPPATGSPRTSPESSH